jgi:hypothetical protein
MGETGYLGPTGYTGPTGTVLPDGTFYSDYLYWDSNTVSYNVGSSNIHLGKNAGFTNQGTNSIAIGQESGYTQQGNYSIAIGYQSGYLNQSTNAIAIGYLAGASQQLYPSIILSAHTNAAVNAATSGFYAFPIRTTSTESGLYPLSVNSTNEIINNTGDLTIVGNLNLSNSSIFNLGNLRMTSPSPTQLTIDTTLTQANILSGIIFSPNGTGSLTLTLPDASSMVSGLSVAQVIPVYFSPSDTSSFIFNTPLPTNVTFNGFSGGISGASGNGSRLLYFYITDTTSGTEAYTIFG